MEVDTFAISPNAKHNNLTVRRLAVSENEGLMYALVKDRSVPANEAEVVQLSLSGEIVNRSGPLIAESNTSEEHILNPPKLNDIARVDALDSTIAVGQGIFILDANLKTRLATSPLTGTNFVAVHVAQSQYADAIILAVADDLSLWGFLWFHEDIAGAGWGYSMPGTPGTSRPPSRGAFVTAPNGNDATKLSNMLETALIANARPKIARVEEYKVTVKIETVFRRSLHRLSHRIPEWEYTRIAMDGALVAVLAGNGVYLVEVGQVDNCPTAFCGCCGSSNKCECVLRDSHLTACKPARTRPNEPTVTSICLSGNIFYVGSVNGTLSVYEIPITSSRSGKDTDDGSPETIALLARYQIVKNQPVTSLSHMSNMLAVMSKPRSAQAQAESMLNSLSQLDAVPQVDNGIHRLDVFDVAQPTRGRPVHIGAVNLSFERNERAISRASTSCRPTRFHSPPPGWSQVWQPVNIASKLRKPEQVEPHGILISSEFLDASGGRHSGFLALSPKGEIMYCGVRVRSPTALLHLPCPNLALATMKMEWFRQSPSHTVLHGPNHESDKDFLQRQKQKMDAGAASLSEAVTQKAVKESIYGAPTHMVLRLKDGRSVNVALPYDRLKPIAILDTASTSGGSVSYIGQDVRNILIADEDVHDPCVSSSDKKSSMMSGTSFSDMKGRRMSIRQQKKKEEDFNRWNHDDLLVQKVSSIQTLDDVRTEQEEAEQKRVFEAFHQLFGEQKLRPAPASDWLPTNLPTNSVDVHTDGKTVLLSMRGKIQMMVFSDVDPPEAPAANGIAHVSETFFAKSDKRPASPKSSENLNFVSAVIVNGLGSSLSVSAIDKNMKDDFLDQFLAPVSSSPFEDSDAHLLACTSTGTLYFWRIANKELVGTFDFFDGDLKTRAKRREFNEKDVNPEILEIKLLGHCWSGGPEQVLMGITSEGDSELLLLPSLTVLSRSKFPNVPTESKSTTRRVACVAHVPVNNSDSSHEPPRAVLFGMQDGSLVSVDYSAVLRSVKRPQSASSTTTKLDKDSNKTQEALAPLAEFSNASIHFGVSSGTNNAASKPADSNGNTFSPDISMKMSLPTISPEKRTTIESVDDSELQHSAQPSPNNQNEIGMPSPQPSPSNMGQSVEASPQPSPSNQNPSSVEHTPQNSNTNQDSSTEKKDMLLSDFFSGNWEGKSEGDGNRKLQSGPAGSVPAGLGTAPQRSGTALGGSRAGTSGAVRQRLNHALVMRPGTSAGRDITNEDSLDQWASSAAQQALVNARSNLKTPNLPPGVRVVSKTVTATATANTGNDTKVAVASSNTKNVLDRVGTAETVENKMSTPAPYDLANIFSGNNIDELIVDNQDIQMVPIHQPTTTVQPKLRYTQFGAHSGELTGLQVVLFPSDDGLVKINGAGNVRKERGVGFRVVSTSVDGTVLVWKMEFTSLAPRPQSPRVSFSEVHVANPPLLTLQRTLYLGGEVLALRLLSPWAAAITMSKTSHDTNISNLQSNVPSRTRSSTPGAFHSRQASGQCSLTIISLGTPVGNLTPQPRKNLMDIYQGVPLHPQNAGFAAKVVQLVEKRRGKLGSERAHWGSRAPSRPASRSGFSKTYSRPGSRSSSKGSRPQSRNRTNSWPNVPSSNELGITLPALQNGLPDGLGDIPIPPVEGGIVDESSIESIHHAHTTTTVEHVITTITGNQPERTPTVSSHCYEPSAQNSKLSNAQVSDTYSMLQAGEIRERTSDSQLQVVQEQEAEQEVVPKSPPRSRSTSPRGVVNREVRDPPEIYHIPSGTRRPPARRGHTASTFSGINTVKGYAKPRSPPTASPFGDLSVQGFGRSQSPVMQPGFMHSVVDEFVPNSRPVSPSLQPKQEQQEEDFYGVALHENSNTKEHGTVKEGTLEEVKTGKRPFSVNAASSTKKTAKQQPTVTAELVVPRPIVFSPPFEHPLLAGAAASGEPHVFVQDDVVAARTPDRQSRTLVQTPASPPTGHVFKEDHGPPQVSFPPLR